MSTVASEAIADLPETVLQFGGGNFLRAFADLFIEQANRDGQRVGRIVIVQSTSSGIADQINRQHGRYHVLVRGLRKGKPVNEIETVNSVSRALDARSQWKQVLEIASSPTLRYIISNTTEAGLALDPVDQRCPPADSAPESFPAKLLDFLWNRFKSRSQQPLVILPCELIPQNGDRLRELVLQQASRWQAPLALIEWLRDECRWMNSLVDRIVAGRPVEHALLAADPLLTVAEPFAMWAIDGGSDAQLFHHPAIHRVDDIAPFQLQKIRILNGAHTALVAKAMPMHIATVLEAIEHPTVGPWLRELLNDEIVPTITDRVPDAIGFAAATLERFANPFIEHQLSAIAMNHSTKLKTRLAPTRDEYTTRFGRSPKILDEIFSTAIAN